MFLRGPSASEHRRTSVSAPAMVSALSHIGYVVAYGFHVVAYGFQSPLWRPKCQYLGRCTVCLGTSAHRPCFDLSVCLQPLCLSSTCLSVFNLSVCLQPVCLSSTRLSVFNLSVCLQPVCLSPDSQSDCLRFFSPPRPPSLVDSLDSEV